MEQQSNAQMIEGLRRDGCSEVTCSVDQPLE
jgi:hypothetical protein